MTTQMTTMTPDIADILHEHYGDLYKGFRALSQAAVEGAVVSGSGLNKALEHYHAHETINTADIPGFPAPTVAGHSSFIRIVEIEGRRVAHFTGRCHLYEGYTMQQSLAQIGLAWLLGARFVVLTNSAGGMSPVFTAGDVMIIADSHNLMFRSVQRGWMTKNTARNTEFTRSASGESIFSSEWRSGIANELARRGVPFQQGTYIAVTGPTFETPAEARMYKLFGGQAIGMSTVHEAEFARVCGMRVAGCSLISNMLPETIASTVSHDEVIHAAAVGAPRVAEFIAAACKTVG